MTETARYIALIPAAGVGARMAAASPKQYLPLLGKPMLQHTAEAFAASELVAHTYIVVSPDDGYIGATFTVRFEGFCRECQALLIPGEDAGYVDDEVVCGDCYEDAKRK